MFQDTGTKMFKFIFQLQCTTMDLNKTCLVCSYEDDVTLQL